MTEKPEKRPQKRPWAARICARFARDRKGVAAVEFALIVPIMITAYLASVEVSQMLEVNRSVGLTAQTITNITSQYSVISASQDIPDILNASAAVMNPFPASNTTVIISLITIDNKGKATIGWSKALNGTAHTAGAKVTVPAALDVASTSILYGETTYAYSPFIDIMKWGTINLNSSLYMLPRVSTTITLTS